MWNLRTFCHMASKRMPIATQIYQIRGGHFPDLSPCDVFLTALILTNINFNIKFFIIMYYH